MASPDWSVLTNAISFGALSAGLLAAGAALVGVYLAIKGVQFIIYLVRDDDYEDPYDGTGRSGLDFRGLVEQARDSYERNRRD